MVGELASATEYQFCVRIQVRVSQTGFSIPEQCVSAWTAPTAADVHAAVGVDVECNSTSDVEASFGLDTASVDRMGAVRPHRFDWQFGGSRSLSGSTAVVSGRDTYTETTDIYDAGDLVTFTASAVYVVGSAGTEELYYQSAAVAQSGDGCVVPHGTLATADIWASVLGTRTDDPVTVAAGTVVRIRWITSGGVNGVSVLRDGAAWQGDATNLSGVQQVRTGNGDYEYEVRALNADNVQADDEVMVIWQTLTWEMTVEVDLIIVAIPAPALTVNCESGSMNLTWTVEDVKFQTLVGFRYRVEYEEAGRSDGELGPTVRSVAIQGAGERLIFVLWAVYQSGASAPVVESGSATRTCLVPEPISNLMLDCGPEPGNPDGVLARATWTAPSEVLGLEFLRYEYTWYFADEGSTRAGTITSRTTITVSSQSNDYAHDDTARFEIRAVFQEGLTEVATTRLTASDECMRATRTPTNTATNTATATATVTTTPTPTDVPPDPDTPTPTPTPTGAPTPTPTITPTVTPTPTPTEPPPAAPLIEPQPLYFDPTLPPVLFMGTPFYTQVQSHHAVVVISRPNGYISLDAPCQQAQSLRSVQNGDVIAFTGCVLTAGPNDAEVAGIWPKDGRTLLFHQWIEIRRR